MTFTLLHFHLEPQNHSPSSPSSKLSPQRAEGILINYRSKYSDINISSSDNPSVSTCRHVIISLSLPMKLFFKSDRQSPTQVKSSLSRANEAIKFDSSRVWFIDSNGIVCKSVELHQNPYRGFNGRRSICVETKAFINEDFRSHG